jgi:hypothetical protein
MTPIMTSGEATGRVTVNSTGFIQPAEALKLCPEFQAQLEEIVKQGWGYTIIQIAGTAEVEVPLEKSRFRLDVRFTGRGPRGAGIDPRYYLDLDLGPQMPAITARPEISEFRVNVRSKSFPRAAAVDLAKGVVTYLDDPFWRWEKGWETDEKKLSAAREILEIARWLLDVKGFKPIEAFKPERYQELSQLFKDLPVRSQSATSEGSE